ncbi:MAG: hypothetical protein QOE38_1032, partial [Thermoleophilaceae bacterium]|nr:hypothetical protein [Thermoleophilaceae bacterium]
PGNGTAPEEIVQPRADGIDVTVPFKGFGSAQQRQAYAKSFFVGWTGNVQHIPARVELTLKTLKVVNALDTPLFGGTSSQVPPGEYGMYLDANGDWTYLNDLVPGLGAVMDNTTFQIDRTIGLNVAAGRRVRLKMATRECDLPHINPCPQTPEVADDNDNPGDATDEYPSVDASLGDHTMAGGPANNPNWTLTYNVKLISRATTADVSTAPPPGGLIGAQPASSYPYAGPPGGVSPAGCADTFPPRARFSRPARVTRRRLALRGHASDVTCGHKRGRVTHVAVAVARRVGAGRCRFLLPTGRFAPSSSCARRGYLAVRGTRAWSLRRRQRMPRGTYTAWTRSVDGAGNVGYTHPAADRLVFRVR